MVRILTWLLGGFLVLLLLSGGVAGWFVWSFQARGPLDQTTTLIVRRSGLSDIGRQLVEAGVIRSPLAFTLGAKLAGRSANLKSGEYAFPAGISANGVVDMLSAGHSVRRKLTVPEGLTVPAVLALVEGTDGLEGDVGPVPPEGTLLPETYFYGWGDRRADVVQRMSQAMSRVLAEQWAARAPDLPLATPEEALTLASIVEKETGRAEERPRVARVFLNRLMTGMRLQSDPTVIYGLTHGEHPLDRSLTRADLEQPSEYNTYQIKALPPGPIANPGRAAIRAVLQPATGQDLYFVADGSGAHAFSQNLADHNRNVAKLRALRAGDTAAPDVASPVAEDGVAAPKEGTPASAPSTPPPRMRRTRHGH